AKAHRRLHTRVVQDGAGGEVAADPDDDALAAEREILLAEMDSLLAAGGVISPSGFRSFQLRAHLLDLRRRVASGQPVPPLTPDQAGRAADALEKTREDNQRDELLAALGGGISL